MNKATGRHQQWSAGSGKNRLAINQLQQHRWVDEATVDDFLGSHEVPIVEGRNCTFLFRGEADEVYLAQRIVGLPSRMPMRKVADTTLWYVVLKVPEGSRINYQIEVKRGDHVALGSFEVLCRHTFIAHAGDLGHEIAQRRIAHVCPHVC